MATAYDSVRKSRAEKIKWIESEFKHWTPQFIDELHPPEAIKNDIRVNIMLPKRRYPFSRKGLKIELWYGNYSPSEVSEYWKKEEGCCGVMWAVFEKADGIDKLRPISTDDTKALNEYTKNMSPSKKKINEKLSWVVSTPIVDPGDLGCLIGILNIDCEKDWPDAPFGAKYSNQAYQEEFLSFCRYMADVYGNVFMAKR
jgi:hypothetical protein